MSFVTTPHRRWLERLTATLSAFAVFMSLMVMLAPAALAHHPEISAGKTCVDDKPYVHFDAISWRTDGGSGSGHPDIRIEVRVNGTGAWTEVASDAFNAGNGYQFSGDFDASDYWGNNIEVQARAVGPWDNGVGGGETRSTSMFLVDQDCTDDVTATPQPQVCAVVQGAPLGAVSFDIAPASGATVQVYANSNYTGPVGGALADGQALDLAPGTYYWKATAVGGYDLSGPSEGSFTIAPCEASTVVVSGQCAINQQGVPTGSVTVTIDPTSGATVQITGPGGPYDFSGSGGSQELAPGTYDWTATPGSGFTLTGDTSGQFTIDPCVSSVTLATTACAVNASGAPLGSVTVTIDPSSGATVQITGPGGPYDFSGSGGSQELAPGAYDWTATPGSGFTLTGDTSGQFTIDPCQATASVSGACLLDGDAGSGLIEVEISTPGAVTVEILDGSTVVGTLTSSGNVTVPEGKTYTWSAAPSSGYAMVGADGGSVLIEACSLSVSIVVAGVCENDVPILRWTVTPVGFTATETTITWLEIDPAKPLHSSVQPLSGEMVWPGAVVGNGKAVDWPGWVYVDKVTKQPIPLGTEGGTFIQGADGYENTRPTTMVQFEVNPTAVVEVDYPGGIPTCAGPDEVLAGVIDNDDPVDDEVVAVELPFTGIDAELLFWASVVLLGSGLFWVRYARRRGEG
ncbi:MAG: hypothetical protein ACRDWS_02515 [Acidimicrobiia bacterium]